MGRPLLSVIAHLRISLQCLYYSFLLCVRSLQALTQFVKENAKKSFTFSKPAQEAHDTEDKVRCLSRELPRQLRQSLHCSQRDAGVQARLDQQAAQERLPAQMLLPLLPAQCCLLAGAE